MNTIDNMAFNFERIKFEKESTKEKDIALLVNYLKTDFVLKGNEKSKGEVPSTLQEQLNNNQINVPTGNDGKRKSVSQKRNSAFIQNDIINDTTKNPNDVVNIISNQTIMRKNKKKPKKMNFQS